MRNLRLAAIAVLGVVVAVVAMPRLEAAEPRMEATTRVSVASDGTEANSFSLRPAVSADGHHVAFRSDASNLVSGDSNGALDVFAHDRRTGVTSRVSVASDGSGANGGSGDPTLSGDGRYVAFGSAASNLVPGDENETSDVFVHDRKTGVTTRVSVASDGTEPNSFSFMPAVSGNGRYVAFASAASNLVPSDSNEGVDVFVHDRRSGATTRVSVASDGTEADSFRQSFMPAMSGNGRYVAFYSEAGNLVPGDTNETADIFVHDRTVGVTTRVNVASDGSEANRGSHEPALSSNGRYVAFTSDASNLVPGDTNQTNDIFVHDRNEEVTTRVNVASDGTEANSFSSVPAVSGNGRFIAFASAASNLVPGDSGNDDVFVHDRQTEVTTRVSIASDGTGANNVSSGPAMSANGRYAAFYSVASNLVPGDTNDAEDVFVHDRLAQRGDRRGDPMRSH